MTANLSNLWAERKTTLTASECILADRLQPVLDALLTLPDKPRFLLAIDGPCGSGKTTLAHLLCHLLDAPCIHMDDFHIPHALKTPERLVQPGGNSDRERLLKEVLQPWAAGCPVTYHAYDCSADALTSPSTLPVSHLLILEGSYAHHPALAAYTDLSVFVQVDPEDQLHRIAHRCPDKLPAFQQRWIPLENAYFAAFHLPRPDAIVIHNDSVQGMKAVVRLPAACIRRITASY